MDSHSVEEGEDSLLWDGGTSIEAFSSKWHLNHIRQVWSLSYLRKCKIDLALLIWVPAKDILNESQSLFAEIDETENYPRRG